MVYILRTLSLQFQDGDLLLAPNLRNDRSQTVLVVPNLQLDDEGTYWCKARNVHGEINATFPVKVYGKQRLFIFFKNIF